MPWPRSETQTNPCTVTQPEDAPEVLRVSRAQTEPAARVTEEKREEGAPEVIRAETVPGSDATAIHWATLLAVAGMLRARASAIENGDVASTDGDIERAYGSLEHTRSKTDHLTDLRSVARATPAIELRAMAEKLERKAVGKVSEPIEREDRR